MDKHHYIKVGLVVVAIGLLFFQNADSAKKALPKKADVKSDDMVKIPAGWFLMGSDDGAEDSRPQRRIYLNAYSIDKYEVTNAQYKAYRDKVLNGRKKGETVSAPAPNCENKKLTPPESQQVWNRKAGTFPEELANHPVTCVAWIGANMYCKGMGKELPTEAQWEKAARGEKGLLYPWGNVWDGSFTNHGLGIAPWVDASDGYAKTAPVGSFPKDVSPYSVYDMGGNVWEWTRDIYSKTYYKWGPAKNPPGPTKETLPGKEAPLIAGRYEYVRRGGSFVQDEKTSLTYLRAFRPLVYRDEAGGFRCVKE